MKYRYEVEEKQVHKPTIAPCPSDWYTRQGTPVRRVEIPDDAVDGVSAADLKLILECYENLLGRHPRNPIVVAPFARLRALLPPEKPATVEISASFVEELADRLATEDGHELTVVSLRAAISRAAAQKGKP